MGKEENKKLPKRWQKALKEVDFAFQPILNIFTADLYGVEALLRNVKEAGFGSIFAFFDRAYEDEVLYELDIALRKKAFMKFKTLLDYDDIKLFYNLDNRILAMKNFGDGNTKKILKALGIKRDSICFEISERHDAACATTLETITQHYKKENYCIAIDDFGTGFSGYKLLYDLSPDIIKIDRYFLKDIKKDLKKRILVTNITQLATQLGIKVIAEGIETKEELLTCKSIGCQYIQGYFIQKPTKDIKEIKKRYSHITQILDEEKRKKRSLNKIEKFIQKIPPLYYTKKMKDVINYLKNYKEHTNIPVVNALKEPVGIIKEEKVKEYLYSPYGISLLLNEQSKLSKLKHFLTPCPVIDIHSDVVTIIKIYSSQGESSGVLITKNAKYYGFLSEKALIHLINEENLATARDQNPLTKLPGNRVIEKYLSNVTKNAKRGAICYFDLDNFKAYNDIYGFRNGDRIIQLFASILKKVLPTPDYFVAHIGGDDFFVGTEDRAFKDLLEDIKKVIRKFEESVLSFYNKDDRERGYIVTKDREGKKREFGLLTCSVAIVLFDEHSKKLSASLITSVASKQKRVAKKSPLHIAASCLL